MDDQSASPRVDIDTLLDRLGFTEQRVAAKTFRWETEAYRRAIESLHGEALQRLVGLLQSDPRGSEILQEATTDEVVYAVLRKHDIIKPPIEWRVQKALQKAKPLLASHGDDFEIVTIEPPRIMLRLLGTGDESPERFLTFRCIIAGALKVDCPEITELVEVKAPDIKQPTVKLQDEGWRQAGLLSEIPPEGARDLQVGREHLLLVRRGEALNCFAAYCPHRGVGIDTRDIEPDGLLTCYRHGYQFDLATGECLSAPGCDLERYETKIADDRLIVKMPVR